ncbi:MAG: HlyC/CorC family transporter, partial [Pseudomonadota bacterium]
ALMTLNRYRLSHLADQGHRRARLAQRLLKRPDRLIGLILLGNNFVNILASAVTTLIALRLGGEGALAIATLLLTLVILIFAEVAPKTTAALHPERIAFPAALIYTPLLRILMPLVWVVNVVANGVMRLMGISEADARGHSLSKEELRTVVHEAGAMIPQRHQDMLLGVLDLERATVEDIMVPRNEIDGIDLQEPLDDVEDFLANTQYTRILVYDGNVDRVLGMVHVRRCMQELMHGRLTRERIREILRPPYYVPEGTPLFTLMRNFQHDRRRMGLVVDEYGDVLGLVTFADLVEEIIGEFATNPADSIKDVQAEAGGSYLVQGSANVRELVRTFRWDLPTGGPKTFNGLILEHLESLPEPNTSLLLSGYPVEILQTEDNRVRMARIWPQRRRKVNSGEE